MPRKKKVVEEVEDIIVPRDATSILPESMTKYVKATVMERAIPDARDGLKPVQRRIIYAMGTSHMGANDKYVKLLKSTGIVTGNYHPHGDTSVNDATVVMSQPWRYNVPLISTEGNNGSLDGDAAAAARYLEVRLAPYTMNLLNGVKDNAVDMKKTFDDVTDEPVVLPAEWPVLFTNGQSGMAVGFATNIASHNPVELLKAADLLNNKPDTTLSGVMRYVKGPDFPTGGVVMGKTGIKDLYKNGKGTFVIRGRAEIEKNNIIITEIPYGVSKKELVNSIRDCLVNANASDGVKDIRDESEALGVRIVIELNKNVDPDLLLNLLYKKSNLQINFSGNHLAIVNHHPVQLGLVEYLNVFLDFKRDVEKRKFITEQARLSARLHIVEGLLKLVDIADKVVNEVQKADGKADAASRIVKKFKFSQVQAEAIVSLRLYQISKQDMTKLQAEQKTLVKRLDELGILLSDDKSFTEEISRQLKETIKSFKDLKRRSEIVDEIETVNVDETALIKAQDVIVVVKPNGVQRMSKTVYQNNKDKTDEKIVSVIDTNTTRGVLLLTKNGLAMQRIVDEIDTGSIRDQVDDLHKSVVDFKFDDELIGAIDFDMTDTDKVNVESVTVSKLGRIKRTGLNTVFLSFNNKGYLKKARPFVKFKDKSDEIIKLDVGDPKDIDKLNVIAIRNSGGKSTSIDYKKLNVQGASGSGQVLLKLTKSDDFVKVGE